MKTVNHKEIKKFSKLADEWWNPNGKFKPLHKFNPSRIKYIKTEVIRHFNMLNLKKPLNKLTLLDIGCGGGLLAEPMSRLGAKVTAIDASKINVKVAKLHSKKNKLKINYISTTPEKLSIKKKYDIILNMEIVEHVSDLNYFIKCCSNLLKKNGIMFIATLNKTLKSYALAIVGAEYILKWLPIGTHDWNNFIKPDELNKICSNFKLKQKHSDGMIYNIFLDEWKISKDKSVNYISSFVKN